MTVYKNSTQLLGASFANAPIAIIIAGVVIFVVAFLGCCGAIQESKILLIIFGICLIVLLLAQIALAIAIYVYRSKLTGIISKSFSEAVVKYKTSNDTLVHKLIDGTQQGFACCGVNGTSDWGDKIPNSCCVKNSPCNGTVAYKDNCTKAMSSKIKSQIGILAGVALLVCLVEIIGMVLAFFLSKSISEDYEKV